MVHGYVYIILFKEPNRNRMIIGIFDIPTYEYNSRYWSADDMQMFTTDYDYTNYLYVLGGWVKA